MTKYNTQLNLPLSEDFKDAIDSAAFKADMSTVAFIRTTLATTIGYDLSADYKPRKVRRFINHQEYLDFYKQKARDDRARAKKLLCLLEAGIIQLPEENNE